MVKRKLSKTARRSASQVECHRILRRVRLVNLRSQMEIGKLMRSAKEAQRKCSMLCTLEQVVLHKQQFPVAVLPWKWFEFIPEHLHRFTLML